MAYLKRLFESYCMPNSRHFTDLCSLFLSRDRLGFLSEEYLISTNDLVKRIEALLVV